MRWLLLIAACWLVGCNPEPAASEGSAAPSLSPSVASATPLSRASAFASTPPTIADEPRGDRARGRELVKRYQCNRCHGGLDAAEVEPTPLERHCTGCHQKTLEGGFDHEADSERWKKNVRLLTEVPTLSSISERYAYGWIVRYLLEPRDLRPHLAFSMPDLDLNAGQARDIATYLSDGEPGHEQGRPAGGAITISKAAAARGRRLLDDKGCTSCHHMSGVEPFENEPDLEGLEGEALRAVELAPDLRHVRERMTPATMVAWLLDPASIQPDTRMPKMMLSDEEARDITAYLSGARLVEEPRAARTTAPEPLARRVTYAEVATKVLDVTCRHCHGNPDEALGDGGPGHSGGFGYPPRGLELTSYERTQAGYLDADGKRHSIFEKLKDGTPRLVASLLARHDEVSGRPREGIRGMPLALPPLPMEDIQLVVTWIDQGRPR